MHCCSLCFVRSSYEKTVTMAVASYPVEYGGRDSFLIFCNDIIRFTFNERDQISRKNFGLSYRNFCLQRRLPMASVVDFIAHLSYVGIKAKLLDDRTSTTYVLCGIAWHHRSKNVQDQVALENGTGRETTAAHGEVNEPHSGDVIAGIKIDSFKNDQESFIRFCESIPLVPCNSGNRLTQSHFENRYREFCKKGVLVEATMKSDLCESGRNGSVGVAIKCKPLRENNGCKNKGKGCRAGPEGALKAVSKRFRSKSVDAENGSRLQGRSKHVWKRNLSFSNSAKKDKCSSEIDSFSLDMEISNFLRRTRRPQRWVTGVLLRDIMKYPLYQIKMWIKDDGSEWVLSLPFYEGIESFRLFVIENITLTGKMLDLILCDDFLKEYHEFCVDRKLLQASDVNINHSLVIIGINPRVKVLKPGQPRYAYSGLAWRHKKHSEKYEKIKVKVILHDRISVC